MNEVNHFVFFVGAVISGACIIPVMLGSGIAERAKPAPVSSVGIAHARAVASQRCRIRAARSPRLWFR
mgnify:FL=1